MTSDYAVRKTSGTKGCKMHGITHCMYCTLLFSSFIVHIMALTDTRSGDTISKSSINVLL